MPNNSTQRELALWVVEQLRERGHQALWAGGCVRDQLLGHTPKDYDVATSALPHEVRELFGQRRTLAIGEAFGVIAVLGKRGQAPIEVATFRTESDYQDGRRPGQVEFSDAKTDAQRRDFTINGMFFDPVAKEVLDYVGGQQDLSARVIRAIGNPQERFAEDKLRLLRAVRFATRLEFEIQPDTFAAIKENAQQVTVVSAERLGHELSRILSDPHRTRGLELLKQTGLFAPLLPELAAQLDEQPFDQLLARSRCLASLQLSTAIAGLFEDGHEPQTAKKLCRRLRLTNETGKHAAWLVESLPSILQAEQLPWPRLQRLLVHELSGELMALAASHLHETAPCEAGHPALLRCRQALQVPVEQLNPQPLVSGDDLIAAGIRPGKHFSALLDHLRDEQLDGRLTTLEDSLAAALDWVARHAHD